MSRHWIFLERDESDQGYALPYRPLFSLFPLSFVFPIYPYARGDVTLVPINVATYRMNVFPCTTSRASNSCSSWRCNALSPTATYATRYQLWTRPRVKITLAYTTTPYEARQVELVGRDVTHATCSAAYASRGTGRATPIQLRSI